MSGKNGCKSEKFSSHRRETFSVSFLRICRGQPRESKTLFLLFWKTNENEVDNKNVKAPTGFFFVQQAASLRWFGNAITFKINIEVEAETESGFSVDAIETLMAGAGNGLA